MLEITACLAHGDRYGPGAIEHGMEVLRAGIGIPENLRSQRSRIVRAPKLVCSRSTFRMKVST